jgi:hypothetical protein
MDGVKRSLPGFAVVAIAAAVLLAVAFIAHRVTGIPTTDFTRDPTALMGAPFYTGWVSTVGVLLWAAAAAIALFVASLLRGDAGAVSSFLRV